MEELTEYEKDVLNTFITLAKNAGAMKYLNFGEEGVKAGFVIDKQGDKWISYILERGEKCGYNEFDDVYDALVDATDSLSFDLTCYLTNNLPSKEEFKSKHKQR